MTFRSVILFNWLIVAVSPVSSLVHFRQWCSLGDSSRLDFRCRNWREFTPRVLAVWAFSSSWVVVPLSARSLSQMIAKAQPEP